MLIALIALALTAALAATNGANDVSKGAATLVGSGVTRYRIAILWGAVTTLAGVLLSGFFAARMLELRPIRVDIAAAVVLVPERILRHLLVGLAAGDEHCLAALRTLDALPCQSRLDPESFAAFGAGEGQGSLFNFTLPIAG